MLLLAYLVPIPTRNSLGFAPGDEGSAQLGLFDASLSRFMSPHPDGEDWLNKHAFLDGMACITFRSSGGPPGKNGALGIMTVDAEGRTGERPRTEVKRRPIDFMGAALGGRGDRDGRDGAGSTDGGGGLDGEVGGGADGDDDGVQGGGVGAVTYGIAEVPAPSKGAITFARAKTQLHGASAAEWRDVTIWYKTKTAALLLTVLHSQVRHLFDNVQGGDEDRVFVLAVLKKFVLAHVALEVPHLRKQGIWKPRASKHDVRASCTPTPHHTTPRHCATPH
jgi:hypothetical protein